MDALKYRLAEIFSIDGEIRRIKLERGLGLAYAGNQFAGRLTLSREGWEKIGSLEVQLVQRALRLAVEEAGHVVKGYTKINEGRMPGKAWYVVRYTVHLGQQLSLLE